MRYVTFRLVPEGSDLQPFGAVVRDDPQISRRAIHQFNALANGHVMILVEFDGPVGEIRRLVEERADVVSANVSASADGVFVYAHYSPDDWTRQLYETSMTNEIFIDMPMYYTSQGALEITAIGELADIRDSTLDLPDGVGLELLSTGEYSPTREGLYEQLTAKQQETLRAAVEAGYYEEPRRVTYEEVADELGVAAGTVGEHLRKIEAAILTEVVPARKRSVPTP